MKMSGEAALVLLGAMLLSSVFAQGAMMDRITKSSFGRTPEGAAVDLYVMSNGRGMQAAVTNYGATLVWLKTPDRQGKLGDVILGYPDINGYVTDKPYLGATVGRYCNRIAKGHFVLNGKEYKLSTNDGPNQLHGGIKGFNKMIWEAKPAADGRSIGFTYVSKDGEEGFPGTLTVHVNYALTDDNKLHITYEASSDKDTVLNLTNHAYFNLAGQGEGDVMPTVLTIHADRFTPVDSTLIPTGELRAVKGTPFDFTTPTAIGARIGNDDEQLKLGHGYDHNFVLNAGLSATPQLAAEAYDPRSGRVLQVWTTEPGVQLYTGNFLDGSITGKEGKVYQRRYAFCLETQHFPDSPNHPSFPTTELKAGAHFHSTTIYAFSTR